MRSTSSRRVFARTLFVVVPATSAILTWSVPAHAEPFTVVSITSTSTTQTVCGDGNGPAGTLWQFSVVGARDSVGNPLIEAVFPTTVASTYHQCYTVQKYGADLGDYVATLAAYAGTDLANAAVGNGTWLLGTDQHVATGG